MARVHRVSRNLSLRTRLLVGLIAIVIVGLVVADIVIYQQIRSYLTSQIDQELAVIQPNRLTISGTDVSLADNRVPGIYISVLLPGAAGVATNNASVHLEIPSSLLSQLESEVDSFSQVSSSIFSVNASGSQAIASTYLVRPVVYNSVFGPGAPTLAFIALPFATGTLNQLVGVDIIVSAVLIAALIGIGYAVVRVGLRPLEDIERIAEGIAGGDLSRRIEQDNVGTEVGRLGASLNTMLGQIETAFTKQQASEDQLRQFLADASHELRTPVTSIRGYAELFRRGAAQRPEDLTLAMRRIEDESIRMGVLVDDLLLLARLDQGRPLVVAPVNLGELATDAAADLQVTSPDRVVSVDVEGTAVVLGDEQRLRQVAMNLLQNARVHTPEGSPLEVVVRIDTDSATLTVIDHGNGIAPEHLGHIFERFYRADPSRTRESGGAGLGLAIVDSIVLAHHGTVTVASKPGDGTSFTVRLPKMLDGDQPAALA